MCTASRKEKACKKKGRAGMIAVAFVPSLPRGAQCAEDDRPDGAHTVGGGGLIGGAALFVFGRCAGSSRGGPGRLPVP